jgi:site-specific DNA recombinase
MNRAVIYVRVSSREQAEGGYSIEAQLEACRRFVYDKGWTVEDEFTELGESARTTNRPAFKAMAAMLDDHGGITHLVVHKIDRLARNLADYAAVKARLQKLGIRLVSVTEGMEEGPSGRLVEGIMAAIAEFYSDNLGQEVRKGMQQKLRNGGWPHLAPAGYTNVRVNGERKAEAVLAIDPEQAPLVTKAFELYASGEYTVSSLHLEMATLGLRNKRGAPLSRSKLAELLHKKLYAGIVGHNGVEYQGTHEPLVSKELFDRVQQVFALHDRDKVRETKHPHFLRGVLVCASCGSALSSLTAKGRYTYFYCLGRFTGRTDCREPYVAKEKLEQLVEEQYRRLNLGPNDEARLRRALEQELADEVSFSAESLALARRRLVRAEHEREKLLQAYFAEALPLDLFKREQNRIAKEIDLAQAEINKADATDSPYGQLLETALGIIRNAREGYSAADPYVKRLWNRALVERIEIRAGQIARVELKEPFAGLFLWAGSNKGRLVGDPGFETAASRSRTVSMPCPPVSDRLPRRPREYEIDQAGVLW